MELFGLLIRVFGGLAIFVYGMKIMGDGLHAVAGEKMRSVLRLFSANRFVAILSARLMEKPLAHGQAERIPLLLHCVNDAEHIRELAAATRHRRHAQKRQARP
jgi:hypothetical protein